MKKILLLFFAFNLFSHLTAQIAEFEGVLEVPNKTANELQSKSREWVADTFNSAMNVIQIDDTENHKLIVQGLTPDYVSYGKNTTFGGAVWSNGSFTLKLEFKDGRYRYSFHNIEERNPENNVPLKNLYIMSHHDELVKDLEQQGVKNVSKRKLEKIIKTNKQRYERLLEQIGFIEASLKGYMQKEKSDNW